VPKKLGLGFARIEGNPPSFQGVNVPSPSGKQLGDDKTLYLVFSGDDSFAVRKATLTLLRSAKKINRQDAKDAKEKTREDKEELGK
jgi:hypothetical protein